MDDAKARQKEAIKNLYLWRNVNAKLPRGLLFSLIDQSNVRDRERLRLGFPYEVDAWQSWKESDGDSFFQRHMKWLRAEIEVVN